MKKTKNYVYVPERIYKPYLKRAFSLVENVVSDLKRNNIRAKCYLIGSAGGRHLVTRLVIDGKEQPFDVDINIEIDIQTLPKKYRNLGYLKEYIRSELNKSIKLKKEIFTDGENSTSVISSSLHFTDDKSQTEFSFDIGIVSRNINGNLQRLLYNKQKNLYTWCEVKKSAKIDEKVLLIKKNNLWNTLRDNYLNTKNNYINDSNYPSFVCYKVAVENTYKKIKNEYTCSHLNPNWDPVGDSAEDD